jgi:type II secretory pathway component GspD/PulD (secretin)
LSSFVSPQATIVANEAGNSIVVTDTQSNIKHLAQIIQAVDNSAEAETEIRVFRLRYANPNDVATELGNIFPGSGSGSNTQLPIRFGGGGGGPGGFFARLAAANAGNNNSPGDRIKKATQVTAVADARIQAVIVTAPKDLMDQIAGMMHDLDVPSQRDQNVYVYHLNNGDPNQVVQVLQNTFGGNNTRSTTGTQQGALEARATAGATSAGNTTSALGTTGNSSMTSGNGFGSSRIP